MRVASVPPSPTADERRQLRRFFQLVEEMRQSRFYRRIPEMDHSLSFSYSPDGKPQFSAPDYDWEDFRSFVLSFRQIALNVSDSVYLPRIRNIIAQYANPKSRDNLSVIKKYIVAILEGKLTTTTLGLTTDEGLVHHSGVDLLDVLVNGELFHSGADHEQVLQQLQSISRGSYLWLVLMDMVLPIVRICVFLENAILSLNLLQSDDLPDRLRDSWQKWCRDHPPSSPDEPAKEELHNA